MGSAARACIRGWCYREEGIAGLEDRCHQVHNHPWHIPAQLTASTGQPKPSPPGLDSLPAQSLPAEATPAPGTAAGAGQPAVEAGRVVPPSGNLWIGGQQVWLGPAPSRRHVTLWADAISLHVLLDGTRIKTLPSRLGVTELSRLAASGARGRRPASVPADPPVRALLTDVDRAQPHKALFSAAPALPPPHGRGSVKQATPTGDPHQ